MPSITEIIAFLGKPDYLKDGKPHFIIITSDLVLIFSTNIFKKRANPFLTTFDSNPISESL